MLYSRVGAGAASKFLSGAKAASKWCGSATLVLHNSKYFFGLKLLNDMSFTVIEKNGCVIDYFIAEVTDRCIQYLQEGNHVMFTKWVLTSYSIPSYSRVAGTDPVRIWVFLVLYGSGRQGMICAKLLIFHYKRVPFQTTLSKTTIHYLFVLVLPSEQYCGAALFLCCYGSGQKFLSGSGYGYVSYPFI
jgi:hypothetical protein